MRGLHRRVDRFHHCHIAGGINGLAGHPLSRQVRLVPHLDVLYAPFIVVQQGVGEIGQVLVVFQRPAAVRARCPRGWVAHAGDNLDLIFVGKVHDAVEFLPGRLLPLVIKEVTLLELDLLPGKLLLDPGYVGLRYHPQRLLYLPILDLFIQKDVDAIWVIRDIGYCIWAAPGWNQPATTP